MPSAKFELIKENRNKVEYRVDRLPVFGSHGSRPGCPVKPAVFFLMETSEAIGHIPDRVNGRLSN